MPSRHDHPTVITGGSRYFAAPQLGESRRRVSCSADAALSLSSFAASPCRFAEFTQSMLVSLPGNVAVPANAKGRR